MSGPDPLVIAWRGRQLRVRHDDPTLGVYTGTGQQIRAAIDLALDERYRVKVSDDGETVRLWHR